MMPEYNEKLLDTRVITAVKSMQQIIETGRLLRARRNVSLKTPLKGLKVAFRGEDTVISDLIAMKSYIEDELNIVGDVSIVKYESAKPSETYSLNLKAKR